MSTCHLEPSELSSGNRLGGALVPDADTAELINSLDQLTVAAILTELSTHVYVGTNSKAAELFGYPVAELVGSDVLSHIHPDDRDAARIAYASLADRLIDGYHVRRRIVLPDGTTPYVSVWGRRVERGGARYGLWILSPAQGHDDAMRAVTVSADAAQVALITTDHDWRIEYASGGTGSLLDRAPSQLRGFPLLGLLHPTAAVDYLGATRQTVGTGISITVQTLLRGPEGEWVERNCLITPMCGHDPPRLGLVVTAVRDQFGRVSASGVLGQHVLQAAVEAHAAQPLDVFHRLERMYKAKGLSARQMEIVARLVAGEDTAGIAKSMFLSASTVRNHLVAIYGKFAVHSQTELLAMLLRELSNVD